MPCVSLQRKTTGFQEETSDLEIQLLELGLIFEDSIYFNGNAIDAGISIANPVTVLRYQLDNHLSSASLELDESASIISYEEYYPYGDTCYRAGRNIPETGLKRYRYTGKEKDEESSLYYHGARYYACWLGRWTAADPIGVGDGVNLYAYVNGNPVRLNDPSGTEGNDSTFEHDGLKQLIVSPLDPSCTYNCGRSTYNEINESNTGKGIKSVDDSIRRIGSKGPSTEKSLTLNEEEKNAVIQDLIDILDKEGEDTAWLEDVKEIDFDIQLFFLPEKINEKYTSRAAKVNKEIKFNLGGKENITSYSNKAKSLMAHELRHVWQENNPEWAERYKDKDIDIEVDAFEIQFSLEKIMGVNADDFRILFDGGLKYLKKEQWQKYKASVLWSSDYGLKNKNYSNNYGFLQR